MESSNDVVMTAPEAEPVAKDSSDDQPPVITAATEAEVLNENDSPEKSEVSVENGSNGTTPDSSDPVKCGKNSHFILNMCTVEFRKFKIRKHILKMFLELCIMFCLVLEY